MSKDHYTIFVRRRERSCLYVLFLVVRTVSSLATFTVFISLDQQFVLAASLALWGHTAFGRHSIRLFPKCSFRLGVLKLVSASETLRREVLLVMSRLTCFDVLLLGFCQRQQPLIWSLL